MRPKDQRWRSRAELADGDRRTGSSIRLGYSNLISATGTWGRPFVPRYPGMETFAGQQLHSAQYTGPERFAELKAGWEQWDAGMLHDPTAPSAGTYRLYFDFRHADVVRTASFTLIATDPVRDAGNGHEHSH